MASHKIYDKTGEIVRCVIHSVERNGQFMSERYVTTTINSEVPIDFQIGDYLMYRGEQYTLNYVPPKKKRARKREYGNAFVYENVKFNSPADELTRCDFLDYVASDNMIHYTGLSVFSFYASSVKDLAERLQVNLDRLYSGDQKWTIVVDENCSTKDVNVSVSKNNCFEVLAMVNSQFYTNFTIKGRVVTIGAQTILVNKVFGYGKGQGLFDIGQTTDQDSKIITRMRAFGSTKNVPYRYYNKHGLSESQYCPNLMLPGYIEKGQDTYIDADGYQNGGEYEESEDKIRLYGIREGTVYFDGSEDLFGTGEDNEIYPTLEDMTFEEVKAAGYDITQPAGDNGHLDEILDAENPDDDGLAPEDGSTIPSTFKIRIKDFGVDLSERENGAYKLASTEGTMTVSMKSGMCQGREFEIVENGIKRVEEDGYVCYELECNRVEDLIYYYPNNTYTIQSGDEFVLIYIQMPDVYVEAAEQRLLKSALMYLPEVYETKYNYEPSIDEHFMNNHPEIADEICEGMIFQFSDADLGIAAAVTISNLVIKEEDGKLTSYEVTLNDDVEASTFDKITAQLDKIASGGGTGGLSKTQVNAMIQSIGAQMFLSKTSADTANGFITFNKGFKTNDNAEFGNFVSGFAGMGGQIDNKGNAQFESVLIRSAMEVYELIVNRQTALEGDYPLTEADTVESIEDLGDGCYRLHLRSKWDGYFTAQVEHNVIKGMINTLGSGNSDYYTSWMRVNSVNEAANSIEVILYPDDETPAGKNYPPCELMRIARWGNQDDETRQSLLYLSSSDGRIMKLKNVTKPIIDDANYAFSLGTLPEFVLRDHSERVVEGLDYLYADGVVCKDIIQIDHDGNVRVTYVDRGTWSAGEEYFCAAMNGTVYETSDVWWLGCKWRCCKTGTKAEPAWNTADWVMIEGNPDFTVDFEEAEQLYDADNFHMTLTMKATLYRRDVTSSILTDDIVWTRYSEDAEGNPRTASDNLWAINHAGIGGQLNATIDDLDVTSSGFPKKVVFTCTATLRDGLTASATMTML